jgi:purine nucleoside phosphorylase
MFKILNYHNYNYHYQGSNFCLGMTAAHEATLTRELKIDYAVVCMIDNPGNGLDIKSLTLEGFREGVHQNQSRVDSVCTLLVNTLTKQ